VDKVFKPVTAQCLFLVSFAIKFIIGWPIFMKLCRNVIPLQAAGLSCFSEIRVGNGKDYVGSDMRMFWMAGWTEGRNLHGNNYDFFRF
jgi:hypothetical protein